MARDSRKGQKGPGRTKSIPTVAQCEKAERAALARGHSSPSRGSTHHPITHTCTHPVCDCVHSPSSIQHLLFIILYLSTPLLPRPPSSPACGCVTVSHERQIDSEGT